MSVQRTSALIQQTGFETLFCPWMLKKHLIEQNGLIYLFYHYLSFYLFIIHPLSKFGFEPTYASYVKMELYSLLLSYLGPLDEGAQFHRVSSF